MDSFFFLQYVIFEKRREKSKRNLQTKEKKKRKEKRRIKIIHRVENKKKKKDFSPRKKHLKSEIAKYGGVNENFRLTIRATVGSSLAVS